MAKIDKSQYTKEEFQKIRNERREQKRLELISKSSELPNISIEEVPTGFVLGNGTSRKSVDLDELKSHGKIYGCNALYRTFKPDYLVAVDVKMILEINKSRYQYNNEVWTNNNRSFHNLKKLNYFHPNKGWSSGPTALWLAAEHGYKNVFILGFDYKGLDNGSRLNNIYADTMNYKKSSDSATYFGNWLRQTTNILKSHPKTNFIRVITPDNYIPEELNKFNNMKHILIKDFKEIFNLS